MRQHTQVSLWVSWKKEAPLMFLLGTSSVTRWGLLSGALILVLLGCGCGPSHADYGWTIESEIDGPPISLGATNSELTFALKANATNVPWIASDPEHWPTVTLEVSIEAAPDDGQVELAFRSPDGEWNRDETVIARASEPDVGEKVIFFYIPMTECSNNGTCNGTATLHFSSNTEVSIAWSVSARLSQTLHESDWKASKEGTLVLEIISP